MYLRSYTFSREEDYTLASFSPHLILRRLISTPAAPPCSLAAVLSQPQKRLPRITTTPYFTSSRFVFSSLSSSSSVPQQFASDVSLLENAQNEPEGETEESTFLENAQIESEGETEERTSLEDSETEADGETEAVSVSDISEGLKKSNSAVIIPPQPPPPSLSIKEKKELASYAHSLGKKLKSQQVGKSGVTHTVIMALIETLEANELLKLKIHGTCPGELEDVMKQLEEATGSVVVGQIGRTVILYRPSLSKMKAEEKKKQVRRDFLKRQPASKQFSQRRPAAVPGDEPRQAGRGRRGGSRY